MQRRICLGLALVAVLLVVVLLLVGSPVPAAVMVPVGGALLVGLVYWIWRYSTEQSRARDRAAAGESWRPHGGVRE